MCHSVVLVEDRWLDGRMYSLGVLDMPKGVLLWQS